MPPVSHCSLPFECRDSEDSGLGPSPAKSLVNPTSPEGSISPIQFGDDRSDSLLDLSPRTDNSYESSEDHLEEEDRSTPIPKSPSSPFQFLLASNNCINTANINQSRSTHFSSSSELTFLCGEKSTELQEKTVGQTMCAQFSPLDSFLCEKKSPQFPVPLLIDKEKDQQMCTLFSSPSYCENKSPQFPLHLLKVKAEDQQKDTPLSSSFLCEKKSPSFPLLLPRNKEDDQEKSNTFSSSSFLSEKISSQFHSPLLLQAKNEEQHKDTQFSSSSFLCEKKAHLPSPLLNLKVEDQQRDTQLSLSFLCEKKFPPPLLPNKDESQQKSPQFPSLSIPCEKTSKFSLSLLHVKDDDQHLDTPLPLFVPCEKKSTEFPSLFLQVKDEDQHKDTQLSSFVPCEKKSPQFPLLPLQDKDEKQQKDIQLSSFVPCEKKSPQFPLLLLQDKDEDQHKDTQLSSSFNCVRKSPLLQKKAAVTNSTHLTRSTFSSSSSSADSFFPCQKASPQFPAIVQQENKSVDQTRSTLLSSVSSESKSLQFPSPFLQEKSVDQTRSTQFTPSTDSSSFLCEKKSSLFPLPQLQEKTVPSFFDEQACRQLDAISDHSFNNDDHPFAHLNPKVVLIRTNFSGQFSEENSRTCNDLASSDCTSSNCSQVGGSSSVDLSSGSSATGLEDGACKWVDCNRSADANTTVKDLVDHIRRCHVQCQSDEIKSYVCLWVGCKVYDRPSCSRSWLDRHILLHGGSKPFRCIVDGCHQRFSSEFVLERHVNSHFPQNKGGQKGERLCRRKRHKHRKRPQSNKAKDYFDEASMEHIRHKLFLLSSVATGETPAAITFRSTVVGRKVDGTGKKQVLLHWSPAEMLPDCWISEKDIYSNIEKTIPISKLPPEVLRLPAMAELLKVVSTVSTPPAKRRRK